MIEFPKYIFVDDSTLTRKFMPNIIRSSMEVGPDKTKRIQNTPLFQITFQAAIALDREVAFRNWFYLETNNGASWFLMKDPIDGKTKRFRFVNAELEWTKIGTLFTSQFELEGYDEL